MNAVNNSHTAMNNVNEVIANLSTAYQAAQAGKGDSKTGQTKLAAAIRKAALYFAVRGSDLDEAGRIVRTTLLAEGAPEGTANRYQTACKGFMVLSVVDGKDIETDGRKSADKEAKPIPFAEAVKRYTVALEEQAWEEAKAAAHAEGGDEAVAALETERAAKMETQAERDRLIATISDWMENATLIDLRSIAELYDVAVVASEEKPEVKKETKREKAQREAREALQAMVNGTAAPEAEVSDEVISNAA